MLTSRISCKQVENCCQVFTLRKRMWVWETVDTLCLFSLFSSFIECLARVLPGSGLAASPELADSRGTSADTL